VLAVELLAVERGRKNMQLAPIFKKIIVKTKAQITKFRLLLKEREYSSKPTTYLPRSLNRESFRLG
jgi:hypothetical protein